MRMWDLCYSTCGSHIAKILFLYTSNHPLLPCVYLTFKTSFFFARCNANRGKQPRRWLLVLLLFIYCCYCVNSRQRIILLNQIQILDSFCENMCKSRTQTVYIFVFALNFLRFFFSIRHCHCIVYTTMFWTTTTTTTKRISL